MQLFTQKQIDNIIFSVAFPLTLSFGFSHFFLSLTFILLWQSMKKHVKHRFENDARSENSTSKVRKKKIKNEKK